MPKNLSRSDPGHRTEEFYTSIHSRMANQGVKWNGARPTIQEFEQVLREYSIPRSGAALDAGCGGTAAAAIACARYGFPSVHAIDVNHESLKGARVLTADLNEVILLSSGTVLSLAFRDETFDFAVCLGVAHHTPEPERVIAELSRVLRPKGLLYFSVYCFADSAFEKFVTGLRSVGSRISPNVVQSLAERSRIVNNFVFDHMYVPTLWLFRAQEIRTLLAGYNFSVIAEWASKIDPFSRLGWLGHCMSGDGLLRVWLCEKR
jgi:ubiquinone/menaquinone biosynthesis C-methylase UbiE